MKKVFLLLKCILVLYVFSCNAEEIKYSLFSIENGKRILISEGVRKYKVEEFVSRKEYRDSKLYGTHKELEIANSFSIGFTDTGDSDLSDFGLTVGHLPRGSNPSDFSWEWFKRITSTKYEKLQDGGYVNFSIIGMPLVQELSRVEFLNDMELDYKKDIRGKDPKEAPSNILIIKAGSVIVFPKST